MGYIKEPDGVDFIIQSPPLTDEERKVISEFIRMDKARNSVKRANKRRLFSKRKKELA